MMGCVSNNNIGRYYNTLVIIIIIIVIFIIWGDFGTGAKESAALQRRKPGGGLR